MGAAYQVQAEYRQFYLMDAQLQPPMPERILDDDLSCACTWRRTPPCSAGALIISGAAGYLPAQPRIEVPAGPLRGRAGFRAGHGREACHISLWPAPAEARRVLKRK